MKRETIKEFDKLGEALSTLNAQFAYRLMNLCVKAEPVSLLSIEAMIEGESQHLEKCAKIGLEDEYTFQIFPNYSGDIPVVAQAIFKEHPEFKQEMKTMKVNASVDENKPDEQDVPYIQLTMPEVDDERYDVLKNGVNAIYEANKAQMEAVTAKADAKFAELIVDESKKDIEQLKEARDKQTKTWYEQRDSIYNNKLKEIEEGHNKWLVKQARQKMVRHREEQ
jgi:hypothetical protein